MSLFLSQHSRIILLYFGFATLFGVGILGNLRPDLFVSSGSPLNPDDDKPGSLRDGEYSKSVEIIETLEDWNSVAGAGQHIVFIDCNWNLLMVAFRKPFSSFAEWCRDETDYLPASVEMIAFSDDERSVAVQELL